MKHLNYLKKLWDWLNDRCIIDRGRDSSDDQRDCLFDRHSDRHGDSMDGTKMMEITVSMSLEAYNKSIEEAKRDGMAIMLDHIEGWKKSGLDAKTYVNHRRPAIPSMWILKFFEIMEIDWGRS